ncbi:MAG: hypothetical protein E2O56_02470 [Gammaproteobacteria bacterium]|nr:MAG: hypothetical protein E2O56_02470 [Gammaproteobacteria bacterium]
MSYILEALKKSEARRRSGQPPDLTRMPPSTARRGGRWPMVLVTVLVLGAGSALGVWLATSGDPDGAPQTSSAPAGTASTPETTAPGTTAPGKKTTTHVAVADRVRRAAGKRRPDDTGKTEAARPDDEAIANDSAPEAVTSTSEAAAPVTGTNQSEPGTDALAEVSSPPDTETPATEAIADVGSSPNPLDDLTALAGERFEAKNEPEAQEPEVKEPGPPLVRELTWSFRSQLPPLALNVHMYTQDPAQRFVLINMRRYQEGDTMEDSGILVRQVVPEGVVLHLAGRDFLLGR